MLHFKTFRFWSVSHTKLLYGFRKLKKMQSQVVWTIIMVYFDRHIFEVLQQFKIFQIVFLQLGAESGVDNPNLKAMKTVFRIMPFVILPMTINFPTVSLSHSFLPQVFFNCICYGIWSVFSCHAVVISIMSLICVFYRRCSPTGWPLTSSHWVRWPCWDTRSWDRSYASRNASHTQLQRFLPMKVS